MERTPTASKGNIQAFSQSGKPCDPRSYKQLQLNDNIIILFEETYTPLYAVEKSLISKIYCKLGRSQYSKIKNSIDVEAYSRRVR